MQYMYIFIIEGFLNDRDGNNATQINLIIQDTVINVEESD